VERDKAVDDRNELTGQILARKTQCDRLEQKNKKLQKDLEDRDLRSSKRIRELENERDNSDSEARKLKQELHEARVELVQNDERFSARTEQLKDALEDIMSRLGDWKQWLSGTVESINEFDQGVRELRSTVVKGGDHEPDT